MLRISSLLFPIFLLGCSNDAKENDTWVKPDSITISCDNYFSITTEDGVITNNVWNMNAASTDSWSQCLEKREIEGKTQFGWSWSWPLGRNVIYSQPQIKIGASPWAPEPKFNNAFPLKISDLKKLNISHHIDVSTNGNHNTTTTMWLITEPYTGSSPNKSIIAAEIMIWTYATEGHLNPAGHKRGEITIEDTTWEVWHQKDWEDKSGANDNKWINISFRSKKSSLKANIPALRLLRYAIENNLISDDLFIADVELGNEIMSGSGIAWVKDFRVVFE